MEEVIVLLLALRYLASIWKCQGSSCDFKYSLQQICPLMYSVSLTVICGCSALLLSNSWKNLLSVCIYSGQKMCAFFDIITPFLVQTCMYFWKYNPAFDPGVCVVFHGQPCNAPRSYSSRLGFPHSGFVLEGEHQPFHMSERIAAQSDKLLMKNVTIFALYSGKKNWSRIDSAVPEIKLQCPPLNRELVY